MRQKKVERITQKYKKKEQKLEKQNARKKKRKKNEIQEIKDDLNSKSITVKQSAIRKIIGAMTLGKDVSVLFPYIVKNMETSDLKLKKLIYLYIINYARIHTELAIMATNTFQKGKINKMRWTRVILFCGHWRSERWDAWESDRSSSIWSTRFDRVFRTKTLM